MTTQRLAWLMAALGSIATPAIAQQTLTFDNTTPQITVPLTSASTFTFEDDGNVHATCQLGPDNRCLGLPASTCPVPPGASILADAFSQAPVGTNQYVPGTSFTIFPTVTGADLCVRNTSGTTPLGTGWGGVATTNLSQGVTVLLPQGSGTYEFSLTCYGAGGRTTSSTITLTTSAGSLGDQCPPGTPSGAPGFTRYLPYDEITDIPRVTGGGTLGTFPNTGGGVGRLVIPTGTWVSLKFTAPSDPSVYLGLSRQFWWQESQQQGAASLSRTYITVSQCPGDFRAPPAGSTAPTSDPTYARGCRNLRNITASTIKYTDFAVPTASTDTECNLTRGGTYYFNMILASPLDGGGIQPGETSCPSSSPAQCGIQFKGE